MFDILARQTWARGLSKIYALCRVYLGRPRNVSPRNNRGCFQHPPFVYYDSGKAKKNSSPLKTLLTIKKLTFEAQAEIRQASNSIILGFDCHICTDLTNLHENTIGETLFWNCKIIGKNQWDLFLSWFKTFLSWFKVKNALSNRTK